MLQRRLLRYLIEKTSNRYLITTHSAHLLDAERTAVYHLTLTPEGTQIQRASDPGSLYRLCADLGYRPSDLLQANSVLWVEGPSDRIYLRRGSTSSPPTNLSKASTTRSCFAAAACSDT